MKLLYVSAPCFADCDFPLIREYQQRGYDVTYLISLRPHSLHSTLFDIKKQIPQNEIIPASRYSELEFYADYINLDKVFIANCPHKKDTSLVSLKMALKINKFIRKENFDVIHTDCEFSFYGILNFIGYFKKTIITIHDPFPHSGEGSLRKTFFRKITLTCLKRYVLLNDKQKEQFKAVYRIDDTQILINRLGVYDCINCFKRNGKVSNKTPNVLFFGRISPYKGVDILLKAMELVHKNLPNINVTIAGSGKMYFDITPYEQLDYVDIQNQFISMQQLSDLLDKATVVVCPYTDATQSGVIMTAFAKCCPVIATNVGGLTEMVDDGKNGLIISPNDPTALAEAIIKLCSDKELVKLFKYNIKSQYFIGERSWSSIANKYFNYYTAITDYKAI